MFRKITYQHSFKAYIKQSKCQNAPNRHYSKKQWLARTNKQTKQTKKSTRQNCRLHASIAWFQIGKSNILNMLHGIKTTTAHVVSMCKTKSICMCSVKGFAFSQLCFSHTHHDDETWYICNFSFTVREWRDVYYELLYYCHLFCARHVTATHRGRRICAASHNSFF